MLTRVYVGHPTSPLAGQTDTDTFTYDRNGRMLSGIKGRYNNTENNGSGLFCAKHPKGRSGKRDPTPYFFSSCLDDDAMLNPLIAFHTGIHISDLGVEIPWHLPREFVLAAFPKSSVVMSENPYWLSVKCTILNIHDVFHFNFVPHPDQVFHEINWDDRSPDSMAEQFLTIAGTLKSILGPPSLELGSQVRWHDKVIVIDLSLKTEARMTPNGPTATGCFLSFQNSTRYSRHWNNQPWRTLGFD